MAHRTQLLPRLACAAGAAFIAAACAKHEPAFTGSIPTEYRDRHPIVVAPAEESLDIFLRGTTRSLDQRQLAELRALALEYQASGQGPVTLLVPNGVRGPAGHGAAAVRAALAGAGVRSIAQSHYRVEGPATDQPIRVVYTKLKARVATKCGQWPQDMAGLQGTRSWGNEPYYNFGCAYQNALATQVADPLDLVRGRTEDRSDTARRIKVIELQRSGQDPSTQYRSTGTTINNAVGTN